MTTFKQTRNLGFLLLPEFTLLAFSAAVDPLQITNQIAQKPLYRWTILSEDGGPVASSSGVDVSAHCSINDLPKNLQLLTCAGNNGMDAASAHVLSRLRHHVRFGGTVGGICTGATTLARAGLLKERTFYVTLGKPTRIYRNFSRPVAYIPSFRNRRWALDIWWWCSCS